MSSSTSKSEPVSTQNAAQNATQNTTQNAKQARTPVTARSAANPASVTRQVAVHNNLVRSEALMDSDGLLWIEHDNSLYQLRRTASGKLILTK
ncbi:MAG: hemin uptake protein HemP [Alcanivorax sp.]|nr:hemin uptake protein HemP [Alcanivorax sp.]